jgi:hypothetical protein
MQKGKTYSDLAVYIPYEDAVMKGPYPPERQRVWVWGEYELRYIYPPEETRGYHPLWINRKFLEEAKYTNGKLNIGNAAFSALYIDVKYMDARALKRVVELAEMGLPICLKNDLLEPGKVKSVDFDKNLEKLKNLPNVSNEFDTLIDHPPLIEAQDLPDYWCRVEDDGTHYIFLAQKPSKDLKYPVYSGQSFMDQSYLQEIDFYVNGKSISLNLEFKPYQSIIIKVSKDGEIEYPDINFLPKNPIIKPREQQRMHF